MDSHEGQAEITKALSDALREVFGENTNAGRFVDVSRIPLICSNIHEMHENIKEIKDILDKKYVTNEAFLPVRNVVYGMVGLILIAVVTALIALVVRK